MLEKEILDILYRESQKEPIEMTVGEIFWKTNNPSITERQIKDVLEQLVKERKVTFYLSKYTLDKLTFLELKKEKEETVAVTKDVAKKPEAIAKKVAVKKNTTPSIQPKPKAKKATEPKPVQKNEEISKNSSIWSNIIVYTFIVLTTFIISFLFFNTIDTNENLIINHSNVNTPVELEELRISKIRFQKNPTNEIGYALQIENKNNKELITVISQLKAENNQNRKELNKVFKVLNEKQNEIIEYQNKVSILFAITLVVLVLTLIINRSRN